MTASPILILQATARRGRDAFRSALSGLRSCRLCWRITLSFLLVFGALEFLFLDLSTEEYRAEQLRMVEREALVVARTIVRASKAAPDLGFEEMGTRLRDNSVLVGMETFSETGRPLERFGETIIIRPDIESRAVETRRVVNESLERMEVVWPPSRLHAPYFGTALIDIAQVDGLVTAYRDRMIWSFVLLALATTVAAMVVLEILVLRPVRALERGLRDVAGNPDRSGAVRLEAVGKDELADIASGFQAVAGCLQDARVCRGGATRNQVDGGKRSAATIGPVDVSARAGV